MKKKSLFKRLSSVALAFLLSLSALTQGITASAFSDKNQATQQWLSTWSYDFRGSGLPNGYDIETGKYNDTHFTGYFASEVPYFTTSDNNYAYCINFDKLHNSGTVSKQQTLNDYMKKGHIPDDMQYQIKEFCIYSYKGKTQYGYSKDIELCASSVMSQAVSARFFDESTTGLSSNETKLLNSYYYNGNNASAHHQELVECYKKMKSEMLSHYDIPKGTSKKHDMIGKNATYPAKYDVKTGKWTATVKLDSTLSQFSISKPNAVTSQKSGSQVILTADNEKDLKNTVITITKTKGKYVEHIDECSPLILSGGSDVQEMVVSCYEDKDPVKAYLKITTPTGSAHLDKSFTDYFDNKQTATADMYKAVKFQLVRKVGDSYKFVKATGKDGSYSFTDLASQATDLTPNNKGDIDVTGLPEGDYEWREISTADGYMISSKKAITVTADKTAKTEFINKASAPDKGKITIHKRDAETRADLAGAKFEVAAAEDIYVGNGYCIYPKGTVIDTITTGADGIAETTKAIYKGYSYTVTEIEAPKGYSISDEPTQTIKLVEQQAEFVVDFENEQNTIPFEITKTDISTGELIPDCTFEILNENNEQVITGTTDENGIAHFQLAIGKYFYREISAPDIYEIDDSAYPFEITENDDIVKAKMTNKKKTGSIKVTKTTTGNLNIEGIKFFATGISDTNKDLKFEATTNENGVAMFDKLVIGKYVITEDGSTVPAAYLTADEQEVTVEYNETAEVAFENIEKTGSITVHKTTEGQKNIEGITFYLRGTSDSGREINIPATTDKDGVAVFENVPIGTYSIIEDEETVPYGYLVADEKEVTVIYSETVDAEIINNEQTGTIKVHKRTEGDLNISGITFYLKGTSDSGREINIPATTDKDGVAVFENVPVGTYMVIEDEKNSSIRLSCCCRKRGHGNIC
ncbi:SpaA isopeptide-forming pilin-related protein [Ruminococcus sp.]|uniref:SpaA isopeptide-forming pilin-related protein n=2 Tax=Ruminococcus sp. TaxID=41978 RepID=UPI0039A3EE39